MRLIWILLVIAILSLAACSPTAGNVSEAVANPVLLIIAGENQQTFTIADLQALPISQASFNNISYQGVTIATLLETAGIDLDAIKVIKAVALDGYTINYDPAQVLKENALVAFALADGSPLTSDDGNFRMVLPDEEGKLNLRMLAELQIIP